MPRQNSSYRAPKAGNAKVSNPPWASTPGPRNLESMTASHLRDTQNVVTQELSPRKSQVRACVLRRNGGRYMLPRSPRTPTTMQIGHCTRETPSPGRSRDYVPAEGTMFFLPPGSASEFNPPPVSSLKVEPFRLGLQVASSPSRSCFSLFQRGFAFHSS